MTLRRRDLLGGSTAAMMYLQHGSPPGHFTQVADMASVSSSGTARTIYNHSLTAAPAGSPVVMLASFAPGELPAGGSVLPIFRNSPLSAGSYQQGQFSSHPDGSLHEGIVTLLVPAAVPAGNGVLAGSLAGLVLKPSATAPTAAEPITLAQIRTRLATADITLEATGCDLGVAVYVMSCAEVLATFSAYPWGTEYPLGGYRVIETGPFPLVEFWRYLKNAETAKSHAWVKARLFVRFFSAAPGGLALVGNPILENDNCYGPVRKDADLAVVPRPRVIMASVTCSEGSKPFLAHGGPHDPRAIVASGADLMAASNTLGGPLLAKIQPNTGVAWTFSGSGVPTGLSPNEAYWPVQVGKAIYLATARQVAQNTVPVPWAPKTAYSPPTNVLANNTIFVCAAGGTSSGSSPLPPIGDKVADGSITWARFSPMFGAARSGAVVASPAIHVSQRGHQRLGGPSTAPAWIGAGFDLIAGHDLAHLFRQTRSTPAYDPSAVRSLVPASGATMFIPGMGPSWGWNTDNTGNGGDDDRIGPINHTGIQALYRPNDTVALRLARCAALQFADYPFNFTDERDGLPVCLNNGPAKNGAAYPNRAAPNPGFQSGNGPGYGSPGLLKGSDAFRDTDAGSYQSNYSGYADFSHLARSWRPAYLLTGDASYLITARQQGNAAAGLAYRRTQAVGTTTYYACYIDNNQQRDAAWALAAHGDAVAALPASDPIRVYLLDMLNDAADYLNATFTVALAGTNAAKWGMITGSTEAPTAVPPWEVFMLMLHVMQEKWRGNAPGFATFWDSYFRNYTKIFNPKYGGWISASAAYALSATAEAAEAGGLSYADLKTTWPTIAQMYQGPNTDAPLASISNHGGPLPHEPASPPAMPFLGYDPGTQNDFVTYSMIFLAVTSQMAIVGDPDGPALLAATRARFNHKAPFTFVHPGYGTAINVLQFALAA